MKYMERHRIHSVLQFKTLNNSAVSNWVMENPLMLPYSY